jgi:uncharacterized protein (TIGR00369 family)
MTLGPKNSDVRWSPPGGRMPEMPLPPLAMTADELNEKLGQAFDEVRPYRVVQVAPGRAELEVDAERVTIRPGGTVSGPTLMALADAAAWVVVLAHIGWVPLAVTSNLSINFLRKPEPGRVRAEAELMKLGRRLAVTHVRLWGGEADGLVADASVTYAIPAS